jgi:geranylgeranyl diphosphate synthase type I
MTLTPTVQTTLTRYQTEIQQALRQAVQRHSTHPFSGEGADLAPFYGQMRYHLGWVDSQFAPVEGPSGKLLRPMILLLAYEAAGAWGLLDDPSHLHRALPAAASLELTHNFTLIHDDIVDQDVERHHRPTLWSIWGSSQGINTGDGMFALARLTLWDVLDEGVESDVAVRLGAVLDRTCLVIAEGQYLDLSFERRQDVSVAMYLDMIERKTAVLMGCAAEMGARLGTREQAIIDSFARFGLAIGLAFQVRDDILGVWADTTETGKTSAGDIYRRKHSLPVLHAFEQATPPDQRTLQTLYARSEALTAAEVEAILAIFQQTGTRAYCLDFLKQQCALARHAWQQIPRLPNPVAAQALQDLEILLQFVEATVYA